MTPVTIARASGGACLGAPFALALFLASTSPAAAQPLLRIVLPGHTPADRSIEVLFPEHVTAVRRGSTEAQQLDLFRPAPQADRPQWRQRGLSLEYERELPGGIRLLARATLETMACASATS